MSARPGIRLHCAAPGRLMDALGRPAKDIDFVVPQRQRKGMRRYLEARGYVIDRDLLIAMEGTQVQLQAPGQRHRHRRVRRAAELLPHGRGRRPAGQAPDHDLPVEELLLQKLQIVEMTTTDVMDAGVLLATHRVSGERPGRPEPR